MNALQRVLSALDHHEPDRVPIDIGTSDTFVAREVYEGMARLLGLEPAAATTVEQPGAFMTPDEAMLEALGADVRLVPVGTRADPGGTPQPGIEEDTLADGTRQYTHPDGRIMRRPAGHADVQLYRPAITGPLTAEEIHRVLPASPAVTDWADADSARAACEHWHREGRAVQCNHIIMPVTGTSSGLLDFASWCVELATQPELLCRLMDRYLEHAFAHAESFYGAVGRHMDVVYGLGDDVAQHTGMWMSPADYRRYVKPRHAQIIRFIKARTRARIIHHCCGACRHIIPDLIEIGVDVLNPTQTSAQGMDPVALMNLDDLAP